MAIKSYAEMRKIDVLPHCEYREAKDDKGKKIQVPYLNWAKCKDLLHEHGAERVYFDVIGIGTQLLTNYTHNVVVSAGTGRFAQFFNTFDHKCSSFKSGAKYCAV